ncbi:hypothetical protein CCACVL1_12782 [Corchorus capsularis]|uniref:Uncharacterized protein n=1 Tax=Corchorus capsularis TaxID=210143 RepID=A0A1R3IDU9_COCAP|nr:hypothetical protein CCACVL1_12782 [Corchorus capsularis]
MAQKSCSLPPFLLIQTALKLQWWRQMIFQPVSDSSTVS